jgi:hypothetical protein
MFEHRSEPLLSRLAFIRRLARALLATILIVAFSVLGGTLGYQVFVGLSWSDAFHHACLVLGEHTPVRQPQATSGKIFAGVYILYARLVFFSVVAIITLPLLHRVLHELHLDTGDTSSGDAGDEV